MLPAFLPIDEYLVEISLFILNSVIASPTATFPALQPHDHKGDSVRWNYSTNAIVKGDMQL